MNSDELFNSKFVSSQNGEDYFSAIMAEIPKSEKDDEILQILHALPADKLVQAIAMKTAFQGGTNNALLALFFHTALRQVEKLRNVTLSRTEDLTVLNEAVYQVDKRILELITDSN